MSSRLLLTVAMAMLVVIVGLVIYFVIRISKLENTLKGYSRMMGEFQVQNSQNQSISMDVQTKSLEAQERRLFEMNKRLEQVYKGLGEMQSMARGMEDIKKVLSNVKTRGILGELQLKNILDEVLASHQYVENEIMKPGTRDRVEFAIKLPEGVFLPIDSKFPADTYGRLVDAYDTGDSEIISLALRNLKSVIKTEAKSIRDKYISPPDTTDFAIMFLPFEGLYAEVINLGLVEELQREFDVCVAGPTTFTALLSSLQMGFKTLAVQKRSTEVWKVLAEVKTEFANFERGLSQVRGSIARADDELEKLVGVRTRQMMRKLNKVSAYGDFADHVKPQEQEICNDQNKPPA